MRPGDMIQPKPAVTQSGTGVRLYDDVNLVIPIAQLSRRTFAIIISYVIINAIPCLLVLCNNQLGWVFVESWFKTDQ
jgi:hypothetical protein